jgi:NodT family efflux transporter outer membrane factor (OMF) lipoprotein
MVNLSRWSFCGGLVLLLAGCDVGPSFVAPDPSLPTNAFSGGPEHATPARDTDFAPPTPEWWGLFRDPELTVLERRVPTENLDVQTMTARLAQSRFQRGAVASAQFPSVNGNGSYERQKPSENGLLGLFSQALPGQQANGAFGNGVGGFPTGASLTQPFSLWQYGFDASWEIDLWGRVRRQVESADAQVKAAEDMRRAVLVSSLAEVARDYMQLRGIQAQIRIVRENITTENDILSLTRTRMERGLVVGTDVENAAAQVEGVRAQLPDLERQESEAINALCFLLDQPPGSLTAELTHSHGLPPLPRNLPLGVPSELARRRPDIRQAEAQLHSATADIGVAVGDFYPAFKINGSVGLQALDFVKLWRGSSLQYAFGPNVSMPLFDGGRLRSTLQLREAAQAEAAINYHKTVLQAWHDVVNALVAFHREQDRRAHLNQEADHARASLSLARSRYTEGVEAFINVLDAERTLLQAEQQAAISATNASIDLVSLYKALGGGWEDIFPLHPPVAPPQPLLPVPPIVAVLDAPK